MDSGNPKEAEDEKKRRYLRFKLRAHNNYTNTQASVGRTALDFNTFERNYQLRLLNDFQSEEKKRVAAKTDPTVSAYFPKRKKVVHPQVLSPIAERLTGDPQPSTSGEHPEITQQGGTELHHPEAAAQTLIQGPTNTGNVDTLMGDAANSATTNAGSAVGGSGNANGNNGTPTNMRYPTSNTSGSIVYRNSFTVNSWGFAYKAFYNDDENIAHVSTPLAVIPINQLSCYMSEADFDLLMPGAKAVSCKVKVTPVGYRTAFAANTTTTQMANANHTVFGLTAVGLNKSCWGTHRQVDGINAEHNMIIDTWKNVNMSTFTERLWGSDYNTSADAATYFDNIPTIVGAIRSLPFYYHLVQPKYNAKVITQATGWPKLAHYINRWDFSSRVHTVVHEYEYEFNNGILKTRPVRMLPMGLKTNKAYEYLAPQTNNPRVTIDVNPNCTMKNHYSNWGAFNQQTGFSYTDNIDKPQLQGFEIFNDSHVQPLLYVGIQPIQSNGPLATKDEYTNVQGTWYVETELTVDYNMETYFVKNNGLYPWIGQNFGQAVRSGESILNDINRVGLVQLHGERTQEE